MLKNAFRLLGRLLIVFVVLTSSFSKINEIEITTFKYLQNYDYCRVAFRDFSLFLPNPTHVKYFQIIYETVKILNDYFYLCNRNI